MPQDDVPHASHSRTAGDRDWVLKLYDEEGSFARFQALPVRAKRLVVAAASLTLIRSLFERISNPPQPWEGGLTWVGRLPDGNGEERRLYRVLRRSLSISLENEPAFVSALVVVEQALPAALPNENAAWYTWKANWQFGVTRVADALLRLGTQEGLDPFNPEVGAFLVAQDASVNDVETLFRIATEAWRSQLSAAIAGHQSPSAEDRKRAGSGTRATGRRRVGLDYESAARAWWDLKDEYEQIREPREPNQAEYCDYLSARGISIKPRTLRSYIETWRKAGHQWPPPQP
jgi:hypothetical protein